MPYYHFMELYLLTCSGTIIVILTAPFLFFSILYLLDSAYQFKPLHLLVLTPVLPALFSVLILGIMGEYGLFFFAERTVFLDSLFLTFHSLYVTAYITAILFFMGG